jgi:hypothetical protein
VGSRVAQLFTAVVVGCHHLAADESDRPDGDVAVLEGLPGFAQGQGHRFDVSHRSTLSSRVDRCTVVTGRRSRSGGGSGI